MRDEIETKRSSQDVKTHKDLDVWNKAIELAEKLYYLTAKFPKEEQYGFVSQIRRSAVSIPGNIAEGAARNSNKEFIKFFYVAMGSLSEIETQMLFALRLKLINEPALFDNIESS